MPTNMRSAYESGYVVDGIHYDYNFYTNEDGYYYSTSKIVEGDGMNPLINVARAYGKSELAMMYFPNSSSKRSALRKLQHWISINPRLSVLIGSIGSHGEG